VLPAGRIKRRQAGVLPGGSCHPGRHVQLTGVGADRLGTGQRTPDRLVVRTVPVADGGELLARLPRQGAGGLSPPGAVAWIRHGAGLVGWGEAASISLPAGEDRFTAGEKWLRALFETAAVDDRVGLAGCGPVAFGSFTFDPASDGSLLVVPRTVMGRSAGRTWRTTISDSTSRQDSAAEDSARADSGPAGARQDGPLAVSPRADPSLPPGDIRWHDGSLSAPKWQRAVSLAVQRISLGSLAKVVLARDLHATASEPIDVRVVLRRLAERYPDCYAFACGGLTGATPELLIRREGRQVSSHVLAGTAGRGGTTAQDAELGAALLASAKDAAEHSYGVDSVRDALAPLCDRLDIEPRPSLLRLANVQHLATAVSGTLARDASSLALAAALHPTAAVCGTPADAAMELIRDLEGMDRGRYAGPVGWVDARGNGEWGIALRCGQLSGRQARLFAGCGIVAGSDPVAELAEAQAKFRPMQDALDG
jgi:menaquinone-specific isochorismate synthase